MIVRDYYTIRLPGDLFATQQEFESYAIDVAREQARLYAIPCEWQAEMIDPENIGNYEITVKVIRIRNKSGGVK